MTDKPTFGELENRICAVINFFGGSMPVEHAIIWQGYIGALAEWGLISVAEHDRLHDLLGPVPAGPMLFISLGPDGAHELMAREGIPDLTHSEK